MADTTKKASKVLQEMFSISDADYNLMQHNARRYERTDAGVEDAVLRQIFSLPEVQDVMEGKTGSALRQDSVFSMHPAEFGQTKVFNATNVLGSIGAKVPKKGDGETPEEKLVRLYDENPNFVRNRVLMDKDFGQWGANNLDQLVETARTYNPEEPQVGTLNKVAGTFLYPRSLESMKAGRDVSAKDIVGDVAENVLMALPIGWAAGGLKAGKAAKVLAGIGGAAAVPLATEAMDAGMYSPYENLDRSVFQPTDVAFGASTNIAAPFMLSRGLGRLGRWTYGGNPLAKEGEKLFSKLPRADKEVQDIIKTQVNNQKFVVPDERTVERVEKMLADDVTRYQMSDPRYAQAIEGAAQFDNGIVNEATMKARGELAAMDKAYEEITARSRVIAGYMLAGDSYQEAFRKASALGPLANQMSKDLYADWYNKAMSKFDTPSLGGAVLGSWLTNKYGNNRNTSATLGLVSGLLQSIEPNFSLENKLEELRDERMQEKSDDVRKAVASKVLDGMDVFSPLGNVVTGEIPEDAYWLAKISNDPSIVRGEGLGATTTFKNWWNTRGMKLLNDPLFGGIKE